MREFWGVVAYLWVGLTMLGIWEVLIDALPDNVQWTWQDRFVSIFFWPGIFLAVGLLLVLKLIMVMVAIILYLPSKFFEKLWHKVWANDRLGTF